MVRYLFYTIGDLTYQSPLVITGFHPLETVIFVDTNNQVYNICAEFSGASDSISNKNGEILSPHLYTSVPASHINAQSPYYQDKLVKAFFFTFV